MMTAAGKDILIGIDAGTSVIKAVAFDLGGRQLAMAALPNRYTTRADGAAFQPLGQTWDDCAQTLRDLADHIPDLARRTAAVAVTAQGDGTWLVGAQNRPVTDGWIWLDARAAATAQTLRDQPTEPARFQSTGTGLNACQMGTQLAHMQIHTPDLLDQAQVSLHPKDWLYLNLTGQRATDPSEACFTFGDFRTRSYAPAVIDALGLSPRRALLPEIVDGSQIAHPLTALAAAQTGLIAGTPVSLGYVDVICTALGAGIYTGAGQHAGCTIVGSTGMHMMAKPAGEVRLGGDGTGYVMLLPIPDMVAQIQSNMASTLNIDWILALAGDLAAELGQPVAKSDLLARIDGWLAQSQPASLLYHPYISEAGERGPFVDPKARASFIGLNATHRFADILRAVIEGLGFAARDCYGAMGALPTELRLTGGAARSLALRAILSATVGAPTRVSQRAEAGAAGAAMMAAVAAGHFASMTDCIAEWTTPALGPIAAPDPDLVARYGALYPSYLSSRKTLAPIWDSLAQRQDP